MRTEFEIGGEEKRPIGTCAVQGEAFKPIIQEDCFSVVPANPKPCLSASVGDSHELGTKK